VLRVVFSSAVKRQLARHSSVCGKRKDLIMKRILTSGGIFDDMG
jgi:hypothetical protein